MIKISKGVIAILVTGLIIGIIGIVIGVLWSTLYSSVLRKQLSLTPTSTNFELWKETPIPMYLKLHMFNITNPEAFERGSKPNFAEMGPYVFREVDYKVSQVWNANDTITFERRRVWHFDETLSKGKLTDNVTNINPIAASVAYTLRHKSSFFRDVADKIMHFLKQKLLITKTVNELLFEGYNDKMLELAMKLNLTKMKMDKFAWFYGRNNSDSYDGVFNMDTGTSDLYSLGIVKQWNYKSYVDFYPGQCGAIKGTNGDLWPPLPYNETVDFFVPDICTSLTAKYEKNITHLGLSGVKYISNETIFDNGTRVPERSCYYQGESIPSGVMNISACKWDAPAFISLPHFYLADPIYREHMTGLNPQKENHELSISLEPKTGVPLNVNAKLQLNLLIQPDEKIHLFKNVTKMFVPMLWFAQEATLTEDYAGTIKFIIILETLGSVTFFGIAGIGIIVLFIGIFVVVKKSLSGDDMEVLITRSTNGDAGTAGSMDG